MTIHTPPDAILFDFDGVLAASHALHVLAWKEAAHEQGIDEPLTEHLQRLAGLAPRHIAAGLVEALGGDATLLYARKLSIMQEQASRVPLLPGARELLLWCRARALPHGIASNSPASLVRSILKAHDLFNDDLIILGEEPDYPPKPDPGPYLRLSSALGLSPPRQVAWIIEDSLPGIQAAVSSRLGLALAIARKDLSPEQILTQGASHIFDTPQELLAHLITIHDKPPTEA